MKTSKIMLCLLMACAGCTITQQEAGRAGHAATGQPARLPESLDGHYPPKAQGPVYLMRMVELDACMSGIMVDYSEGDLSGAEAAMDAFASKFREVSELVPEWKGRFPDQSVEKLGLAIRSGRKEEVMAAFGEVGRTCHDCHVAFMVPVQQRYRWGNVAAIGIRDPVLKEDLDYASFKRRLALNLSGVGHDLQQGQMENARKQYIELSARFQALKETCLECHDDEVSRFADAEATARIESLGKALNTDPVQASRVAGLLQSIGQESCSKCHLVHVPAAMAKIAGGQHAD